MNGDDTGDAICVSSSDKDFTSFINIENGIGEPDAGDGVEKLRAVLLLIAGGDVCVGRECAMVEIGRAATWMLSVRH